MRDELEIKNAIIIEATITNDDHGLLSAWVHLDYGGSGQGFGGYSLYLPEDFKHNSFRDKGNYAGHFIWRVMEVAGVTEWSQLKGKTIRAKAEHGHVHAIGHIVKDDWFNPSEEFKRVEVMPKIADFVAEYKESLKFDLEDAIDKQEQQTNEDFNAGREEALKYAIEMIDKHLSNFST